MKVAFSILSVVLLGLVFACGAYACPASYVHSMGTNNNSSPYHAKATQVAEGYMNNRGINPSTPSGQIIKPYVVGTAIVESSNPTDPFRLGSDPVDKLVQEALGTYAGQPAQGNNDSQNGGHGWLPNHEHFELHFGYGVREAGGGDEPVIPPSQTLGG